jgi:hypothetical protein
MILISAQPHEPYMLWQLQVQISNLIRLGFSDPYHIIVSYRVRPREEFVRFQESLKHTNFHIHFYQNTSNDWKTYVSSLRPHVLKKFFQDNPHINEYFYLDSDVVFRELPDWSKLPDTCYASDTVSYIGAEYIISKSPALLKGMAQIVGICHCTIRKKQKDSGGAQYLIRGAGKDFWEKVENDCVKLYIYMNEFNKSFKGHGIQAWCADMWAVLWNLWLIGDCKVDEELSFAWPTQTIKAWDEHKIFHNAGVTSDLRDRLFYKGDYIYRSPFNEDFSYVDKNSCSIKYVEQIQGCILKGFK